MSSYIDSRELVRQRNDLIDLKGVDVNEDDDVADIFY